MAVTTIEPGKYPDSPTSGIQEAIDAMPDEGGTAFLPTGRYLLRRSIVPRTNTTIRGEGEGTVLMRIPTFVTPLTEDAGPDVSSAKLQDVGSFRPGDQICISSISDIPEQKWVGRGYNICFLIIDRIDDDGTVHGTRLYGKDDRVYRLEHDAVADNQNPAIFVLHADGVKIESLMIDGEIDPESPAPESNDFMWAAILQHDSKRCRIHDVTVCRWISDGICIGGSSSDVLVTGCVTEYNAGIGLHSGGGIQSAQWVSNISRHNGFAGFLFCQKNRNVICANNLFHHNGTCGIWGLDRTDRFCIVANNNCHHNGEHGIDISTGTHSVIQGNMCRNNSQKESGKYAGIYLFKARDNLVTGNYCLDDQEAPTQTNGILNREPEGENTIENNVECIAPAP
jgi:parallel beta-helix repeat protein